MQAVISTPDPFTRVLIPSYLINLNCNPAAIKYIPFTPPLLHHLLKNNANKGRRKKDRNGSG